MSDGRGRPPDATQSSTTTERKPASSPTDWPSMSPNGRVSVWLPGQGHGLHGGFSMLNISAWPNDASVCSLSQILETGPIPSKYYLSAKACMGILRRAENRGKQETGDRIDALTTGTDRTSHMVAFQDRFRGREGGAQFEGPHDTANIRSASGGSSRSYVAQQWAVRRLTPTECERLQGFADGHTAIPGAADGPRYKQIGNSFAVPVVAWIGARIKKFAPDA